MTPRMNRTPHQGFSIVELLVVIAIIVVLMSLFLPALQRAREAYNDGVCRSNLNNINKAFTAYTTSDTYQRYPTGGGDIGNPRTLTLAGLPGSDVNQDWGWAYQILKNMEGDSTWANSSDAVVRASQLKVYFCPTRRNPTVKAHPVLGNVAMIDYAGNAGCWSSINPGTGDPFTADQMINESYAPVPNLGQVNVNVNLPTPNAPLYPVKCGIFIKSRVGLGAATQPVDIPVRKNDVTDGFSYTILVAEKRINSALDQLALQAGDRYGFCSGFSSDTLRTADQRYPAARDYNDSSNPGLPVLDGFGAAHPAGFNALFCDGHVTKIRYNISAGAKTAMIRPPIAAINGVGPWAQGGTTGGPMNLTILQQLCHRSDAQEVPQSNFED
jgi:prepilin-type N-terminal cleavage/methylation domain-containing protein/prepilin-type processing-associated H-X9-DG protein